MLQVAALLSLLLLLFRVVLTLGGDGIRQRRHTLVLLVVVAENRVQRRCRLRSSRVV